MSKEIIRVFTSGSFDLFHIGHLNLLERSAALGDELIVGVSTDELIAYYKGMRPIIPFEQRYRIIAALKCVTKAVKQVELTEIAQLQREKIDIVTIGDDWEHKYLKGLEWMKTQPAKQVVYLPYTQEISTTSIKKGIITHTNKIIEATLQREEELYCKWKRSL
jgi:glycerol-3-phosphate cytidylyltransferase